MRFSSILDRLRCGLGWHEWRLYSITDLVWPVHYGHTRQICRRCKKRRTRYARP